MAVGGSPQTRPSPQPSLGQVRPGLRAAGAPGTARAAADPAPARSRPRGCLPSASPARAAPHAQPASPGTPSGTQLTPAYPPGSTCRSPAEPADPLIGCGRSRAPPVAAGHSGNCSPPRAAGPRANDWALESPGDPPPSTGPSHVWEAIPAAWLSKFPREREGMLIGFSRAPTDCCLRTKKVIWH